jgi:hypothetical protein
MERRVRAVEVMWGLSGNSMAVKVRRGALRRVTAWPVEHWSGSQGWVCLGAVRAARRVMAVRVRCGE